MTVLSNPKYELFAEALAKGATASDAYEQAGFKRHDGNAGRLARDPRVQARVKEILAEAAEKAGVTVERIIGELAKIAFADIRKAVKWGETVMVPCAPEVADHFIRPDGSGVEDDFNAEAEDELEPQPHGGALKRRRAGTDGVVAVRAHTPMALIASDKIDGDTAGAIAEVKQTKEGLAFKLHNKLDALEKLGKHLGMFKEKVEHEHSGEIEIKRIERVVIDPANPNPTGIPPSSEAE